MPTLIQCENCGKQISIKPYQVRLRQLGLVRSLCCSRACAFQIRRGRPVLALHRRITLTCEQCGKPFEVKESHSEKRRFCSIACKADYQKTSMLGEGNHYFGRKHSNNTRKKITENHWRAYGEANPNWRGGVTELKKLIRKSKTYSQWRTAVYERDQYRSTQSGKRGRSWQLVAHHKKPFKSILTEFLALYPNLDLEKDAAKLCELAMRYQPFWDVSNGITLLRDEHHELHYGKGEIDDD